MSIFRPLFRKNAQNAHKAAHLTQIPLHKIPWSLSQGRCHLCVLSETPSRTALKTAVCHGTPPLSCAILRCGVTHLQPAGVHHPLS